MPQCQPLLIYLKHTMQLKELFWNPIPYPMIKFKIDSLLFSNLNWFWTQPGRKNFPAYSFQIFYIGPPFFTLQKTVKQIILMSFNTTWRQVVCILQHAATQFMSSGLVTSIVLSLWALVMICFLGIKAVLICPQFIKDKSLSGKQNCSAKSGRLSSVV